MAIKDSYPAIRTSLDLNFAGSRMVDPRITFTRASTATYFDEKGVMRTAPAGVPRIDFDPVMVECKGLLIEEQRTNLLKYSEQFDNAIWSKRAGSAITPNNVIAPDGTLTADKHSNTDTTSNTTYIGFVGAFTTDNTVYCASAFVKRGSQPLTRISMYSRASPSHYLAVDFNLDTLNVNVYNIGSVTGGAGGIIPIGNGWYRVWASANMLTGTDTTGVRFAPSSWGPPTEIGAEYGYIWGAQLEVGAFPTSYIKTEASQVTRAVDTAVMTGTNFSDWYRQDEGTFTVECATAAKNASANYAAFCANDGTINNRILYRPSAAGTGTTALVSSSGELSFGSTISDISTATRRVALAYKLNDFAVSRGGGVAVVGISGQVPPSVTALTIGAVMGNSEPLNGTISRLAYYPKRLTNEQLQAITT